MGKEWFYWGGDSTSTKKGRSGGAKRVTPSCCMSSVFQLFDFHQFQFCLHQQVPPFKPDCFLPKEPTKLKGVEAPRNSLEMEAPFMETVSFPSTIKGKETSNIPIVMQIRTSAGSGRSKAGAPKARTDDLSSEYSSSSPAGPKTPNLVARLMGLDLIPDGCSPSSSSSNHSTSSIPSSKSRPHAQLQNLKQLTQSRSSSGRNLLDTDIIGTRSLPETPRISSARRSDVDHRLSLHLNKENTISEELELSSRSRRREVKQEDESRSSTHYARQIVKRVKESVGRKVGVDITNTIGDRDQQRRDDHVVLLKAKKLPSKVLPRFDDESSPRKQSTTPSCSPRLRLSEVHKKPVPKNQLTHSPKLSPSLLSSSSSVDPQPQSSSKVSLKTKPLLPLQEQDHHRQKNRNQKCKKIASERYVPCLKKLPQTQKEESFVRSPVANRANLSDKKCKRTPLSSELLNTSVPTIFPVKKDPPPPATKSPKQQVPDTLSSKKSTRLSSCLSHTYKQETTHPLTILEDNSIGTTTTATRGGAELQYITGVLKRTGINLNSPVSCTKWYSPSHPVNPSIFHHLELSSLFTATAAGAQTKDSQMSHRCNRKLIFQLVDEILAEILKPHINMKPWGASPVFPNDHQIYGSELIEIICSKIQSFPLADCRVLEDIDALVDKDLCRSEIQRSVALEEEGEAIVAELESDLLHSLVHEMAMEVFGTAGHNRA